MTKILFICHGNICRSPMAEFILKDMVKRAGREQDFEIASAATSREEIGNDLYPPAKACLSAHKVPFGRHRARQITREDLERYDCIVAMESYNIRNLERLLGPSDKYRLLLDFTDTPGGIADPWYSGDFELSFRQITEGCEGILRTL